MIVEDESIIVEDLVDSFENMGYIVVDIVFLGEEVILMVVEK